MAAPSDLLITPFDPATADEGELRAVHAIVDAIFREELPDDRPILFEEWLEEERREMALRTRRRWVAKLGPAIVGWAFSREDHDNNTHLTFGQVEVLAAHRRQGIGTELLRRLVFAARDAGRSSVLLDARDDADHSIAFLSKYGLTPRIREHHNRLLVSDLDGAMLREWVDRAADRASAYDLVLWDGPTPDELLDQFATCVGLMNTAPTEDLDWHSDSFTAD